ncbi:hypothetical protein QOZ97_002618 [Qipengyuania citrea]|jgi:hypothetical protein|uniref:LysR family transcriptional regulator n=1 Tax=Qipengyuania citrea TaxID=225971 RepID=A0ABU0NCA2_9SPHN|nr:hypothetical protein [Qipengyuania citrea]
MLAPLCIYCLSGRYPPAAVKVFVNLGRELARAANQI